MPSLTLELDPRKPLYRKVLSRVYDRYRFSGRKMRDLHARWQENEKRFSAYVTEREADALRRVSREGGKPEYVTLSLPYSYAVAMTAHTYWASVFLGRNPVFQYMARHGETHSNVQAVEALINYQVQVGQHVPALFVWLLDVAKFGVGIVADYWVEDVHYVSRIEEVEEKYLGVIPTGAKQRKRVIERIPGYRGNRLMNVRPYHWYPDTRVPLIRFQEGEFVGRYIEVGWNEIKRREAQGLYFGTERLRKAKGTFVPVDIQGGETPDVVMPSGAQNDDVPPLSAEPFRKLVEVVVELSPVEWGIGKSKEPEKWVFTITSDGAHLIGASPLGYIHDKYPYAVIEYEVGDYSLTHRSMMEIAEPLQFTMDWLVNTHFYNVRKTLNNQFLVDPSRVHIKDMLNPMPGGIWRLRPEAWGTNPADAIYQVPVVDITQGHLRDISMVADFIQRTLGVTDNVMGLVNTGGRKSATEIRSTNAFATNRLKTNTEYFSATGFEPLAQMMLQNTQQYYDEEQKFRVAGDLMQVGSQKELQITPEDIMGAYDFVPVDGTIPIDRFAQANLWREMIATMVKIPQLAEGWDINGIFAWVAQLAGLKNVNQFKVQVVPDGAPGLVNLEEFKRGGATDEGAAATQLARVPEPGQVSGVGTTG